MRAKRSQLYPKSFWNGGMVRHIIKDKVILLERGQGFNIEGKRFFTFGGAASHDVQGGILDRDDPDFIEKRRRAYAGNLPFRIKNESWWEAELPTAQEMETAMENLKKAGYQADYVITHCAATRIQKKAEVIRGGRARYAADILTEYFERIEGCLQYKHWFCGHYHINARIDQKHTVLYEKLIPLEAYMKDNEESFEEENDL